MRREYYLAHREEQLERHRTYYQKNKTRIKERVRLYRLAHLDQTRACNRAYTAAHPGLTTKRMHRLGRSRPMREAKDSGIWLGVHIAETALSGFFDNIQRMPYGNPGYDFICGRGFKIDVKCSCLNFRAKKTPGWQFGINAVADYFLCLAFDNRESLTPQHVWLIPQADVRGKQRIWITNRIKQLDKYKKYEKSLDKVNACCKKMEGIA